MNNAMEYTNTIISDFTCVISFYHCNKNTIVTVSASALLNLLGLKVTCD